MFEEVRLVWNLTLKCRYHCSHCAASARTTFQDNADLKLKFCELSLIPSCRFGLTFPAAIPGAAREVWKSCNLLLQLMDARIFPSPASVFLSWPIHSPLLKSLASSYDLTYDRPWWYHDPLRKGYNLTNLMALNMLNRMGN